MNAVSSSLKCDLRARADILIVISLVVIAVCFLSVTTVADAQSSRVRVARTFVVTPEMETRALELVNAERRKKGLVDLVSAERLSEVARNHSANMAKRGFFNHTDPSGRSSEDRMRAAGLPRWKAIGENIAYNQGFDDPVVMAVGSWMKSSEHRANLMRSMWTETGIGIAVTADGTYYFTEVFLARK
jgi:uncharacterized protein YkwD